jgi:hypothetical protein
MLATVRRSAIKSAMTGARFKALVARLYAQRYLADRGPLRGIDTDGDEAIERFDELAAAALAVTSPGPITCARGRSFLNSCGSGRRPFRRSARSVRGCGRE